MLSNTVIDIEQQRDVATLEQARTLLKEAAAVKTLDQFQKMFNQALDFINRVPANLLTDDDYRLLGKSYSTCHQYQKAIDEYSFIKNPTIQDKLEQVSNYWVIGQNSINRYCWDKSMEDVRHAKKSLKHALSMLEEIINECRNNEVNEQIKKEILHLSNKIYHALNKAYKKQILDKTTNADEKVRLRFNATSYSEKAIDFFKNTQPNPMRKLGRAYQRLASHYYEINDFQEAANMCSKALDALWEQLKNKNTKEKEKPLFRDIREIYSELKNLFDVFDGHEYGDYNTEEYRVFDFAQSILDQEHTRGDELIEMFDALHISLLKQIPTHSVSTFAINHFINLMTHIMDTVSKDSFPNIHFKNYMQKNRDEFEHLLAQFKFLIDLSKEDREEVNSLRQQVKGLTDEVQSLKQKNKNLLADLKSKQKSESKSPLVQHNLFPSNSNKDSMVIPEKPNVLSEALSGNHL